MNDFKGVERELSPEKNSAILHGAMQEFLEHGYAGARIDRIVIAAGVSKATVYRHFADKEALFTALIQRIATSTNLLQQQGFPPLQEEPTIFLKRLATGMFNTIAQDPQKLAFLRVVIAEAGRFPELGRAFIRAVDKPNHDFLTQYFATHPKLQMAYPEVAAQAFVGTLLHFLMLRELLNDGEIVPMERDRLVDGLLDLLIGRS